MSDEAIVSKSVRPMYRQRPDGLWIASLHISEHTGKLQPTVFRLFVTDYYDTTQNTQFIGLWTSQRRARRAAIKAYRIYTNDVVLDTGWKPVWTGLAPR